MEFGRYNLVRLVATGGMAEFWLARQEGPAGFGRNIGIKRIHPHLARDPRFVEMFLDEARIAAQLQHPNIVQIIDFGQVNGQYFLAMEFIAGEAVDILLQRSATIKATIPTHLAVWITAQACAGLDHAHNAMDADTGAPLHIVHRDVSPQNVLISRSGQVKIMDFGVAKAGSNTTETEAGAIKGKYAYMSPEQIRNEPLDRRSDVFALGVLLYELLTGIRPFGGESDVLAVSRILHDPPHPIGELLPDLPAELERIVRLSLEKDRDRRTPSAHQMQQDLEDWLRSGEIVVGPRDVATLVEDLFPEDQGEADRRSGSGLSDQDLHEDTHFGPLFPTDSGPALPADDLESAPTATALKTVTVQKPIRWAPLLVLAILGLLAAAPLLLNRQPPAPTADDTAAAEAAILAGMEAALTPAEGILVVHAPTGAGIVVDGKALGPAPVMPQIVSVGPHVVRVLLPSGKVTEQHVPVEARKATTVTFTEAAAPTLE